MDDMAGDTAQKGLTARRDFLGALAATGAGAALAGSASVAHAAAREPTTCAESVPRILNNLLATEQLATTFYYASLTSPAMTQLRAVASAQVRQSVRKAGNGADLRAVLDQEHKHSQLLISAGATSAYTQFHFPVQTLSATGSLARQGTFLWMVDHLETACIGAYLLAIKHFGALGRPDLALLATRILGVECEHRVFYRVVGGNDPANNVTLEVESFTCTEDVVRVLTPYLNGQATPRIPTRIVQLPHAKQIALVLGRHSG